MQPGDLVLAYQTEMKGAAVGLVRLVRFDVTNRGREMVLEPVVRFDEPVMLLPLKKTEPALRDVTCLRPVHGTLFPVSPKEAAVLANYFPIEAQEILEAEGLLALPDHQSRLEQRTDNGDDDFDSDLAAFEGQVSKAMRLHRKREQKLRKAKINDALKKGHGHLPCEVPGCGFDFLEAYGDIGKGFAHVHHLKGLEDRSKPSLTRLTDLAIVCANCHWMIHRGGQCRPLKGLLKELRGTSA
jgi:hypothetical protein